MTKYKIISCKKGNDIWYIIEYRFFYIFWLPVMDWYRDEPLKLASIAEAQREINDIKRERIKTKQNVVYEE